MTETAADIPNAAIRPKLEPASYGALFLTFLKLGAATTFGDTTALVQRELVERRRWLGEPTLRSLQGLSRIAPGLPPVNLAVVVGRRLGGTRGAVAAVLATLAVPVLLAGAAGIAYAASGFHVPSLDAGMKSLGASAFLTGLAAASAGLAFASGFGGLRRIGISPGHVAIILLMAGAMMLLHWPFALVVLLAMPLSLGHEIAMGRKKPADG